MISAENTRALRRATLVPYGDGHLAIFPTDGAGVTATCEACKDGRALGLGVVRQAIPSGEWDLACLPCSGVAA